eukprot:GDKJ01057513.1.p1 GENE.GDKJ01057513.1~~GDKJ01057513.1.p1  ORF type:complete len:484 (-),score=96.04 GDKJ01057513.1:105-1556(-)
MNLTVRLNQNTSLKNDYDLIFLCTSDENIIIRQHHTLPKTRRSLPIAQVVNIPGEKKLFAIAEPPLIDPFRTIDIMFQLVAEVTNFLSLQKTNSGVSHSPPKNDSEEFFPQGLSSLLARKSVASIVLRPEEELRSAAEEVENWRVSPSQHPMHSAAAEKTPDFASRNRSLNSTLLPNESEKLKNATTHFHRDSTRREEVLLSHASNYIHAPSFSSSENQESMSDFQEEKMNTVKEVSEAFGMAYLIQKSLRKGLTNNNNLSPSSKLSPLESIGRNTIFNNNLGNDFTQNPLEQLKEKQQNTNNFEIRPVTDKITINRLERNENSSTHKGSSHEHRLIDSFAQQREQFFDRIDLSSPRRSRMNFLNQNNSSFDRKFRDTAANCTSISKRLSYHDQNVLERMNRTNFCEKTQRSSALLEHEGGDSSFVVQNQKSFPLLSSSGIPIVEDFSFSQAKNIIPVSRSPRNSQVNDFGDFTIADMFLRKS